MRTPSQGYLSFLRTLCVPPVLLGSAFCATAEVPDYPLRKPGFWELTVRADGMPAPTKVQQCVDAASDRLLQNHDMAAGECKVQGPRRQGDTVLIDQHCSAMDRKITTKMVISGDFQSRTRTEVTQSVNPPMPGMQGKRIIEGRWAGACPAGWKPGDLEVSEIRLNVLRMKDITDLANDLMKGPKKK